MAKSITKSNRPRKSANVPVTKAMLYKVRDELKSETTSIRHDMKAFRSDMNSRFHDVGSKFHKVIAEVQKLSSEVHNTRLLMEEQNSRNIFVLDGYTSLSDRLSKLEKT